MQRKVIRLGVAGTLAALAVSAVGIPAQAADIQPAKPGITTVAAALPAASAPASVELETYYAGVGRSIRTDYFIPGGAVRLAYQWLRNGVPIPGATDFRYVIQGADVGKKLSYRITFSEAGHRPVTRTSNSSDIIPPETPAPIVTGTATAGNILLGTQKEPWAMTVPVTMKYQWLRNGTPIPGATALNYKLTKADLDALIVLRAEGVNGGKVIASSYALPVKPSALKSLTISPQHLYGDPRYAKVGPYATGMPQTGDTIILSNAVWKQSGVKNSVQWLRNGAAIPGATGTIYKFTAADVGSMVTVMITGSLKGYADTIVAALSSDLHVAPAPAAGSMPTISGKAAVGSVLTATWNRDPKAKFSWYRNFVEIPGATEATYKLTAADKGALIVAFAQTAPGKSPQASGHSLAVVPR